MYIYPICLTDVVLPDDEMELVLSLDELARVRRMKNFSLRRSSLASRYALRCILAEHLVVDPAALQFGQGDKGKPYVISSTSLEFNLSHSGDYLLIAVGSVPVGVDVEYVKPLPAYLQLASRFFTSQEYAFIQASQTPLCAFYRVWTAKEAYVKALGIGLSSGLADFSVVESGALVDSINNVYFHSVQWQENCSAMVATVNAVECIHCTPRLG